MTSSPALQVGAMSDTSPVVWSKLERCTEDTDTISQSSLRPSPDYGLSPDPTGPSFDSRMKALVSLVLAAVILLLWWLLWPPKTPDIDPALPSPGSTTAYASWMTTYWHKINTKTLHELTLPGSHNSGNIKGSLNADRSCEGSGWDTTWYSKYKTTWHTGTANLTKAQYAEAFLPWNINHHHSITEQLEAGIRYFHLKLCWAPSAGHMRTLKLTDVRHSHRGFTSVTVASILNDMSGFLDTHPKEFLVIGIHNLDGHLKSTHLSHNFTTALHDYIGSSSNNLISSSELFGSTLSALHTQNKRIAIYRDSDQVENMIPSTLFNEPWDDSMNSGSLFASTNFLSSPTWLKKGMYNVMQANPNNSLDDMFSLLNRGVWISLYEWERHWLTQLKSLVSKLAVVSPTILVNAISSDFQDASAVVGIALGLMGLE